MSSAAQARRQERLLKPRSSRLPEEASPRSRLRPRRARGDARAARHAQFGGSPIGCASSANFAIVRIIGSENLGPTICSPPGSFAAGGPPGPPPPAPPPPPPRNPPPIHSPYPPPSPPPP